MKAEYKDRKYRVEPYDPSWPRQFAEESNAIARIFGRDALAIEHIGGTAVPGMDGKPTIDILVAVEDLSAAARHTEEMKQAGYEYLPGYVSADSTLFRRMRDNELLSNVHVFQAGHPHVREMLALRDYLRSHPEEVKAYSELKVALSRKYPDDYATYRTLKDEYMKGLKERASHGGT